MAKNIKDYYAEIHADAVIDDDGNDILETPDGEAASFTGNVTGTLTGDVQYVDGNLVTNIIDASTQSIAGTLTGDVTGNVTGNVDGNVVNGADTVLDKSTGALTGNADTATTLETAREIGGVSFNGSANIFPAEVANQNGADDDEPTNIKFWTGTQAEYDALTKSNDTIYFVQ